MPAAGYLPSGVESFGAVLGCHLSGCETNQCMFGFLTHVANSGSAFFRLRNAYAAPIDGNRRTYQASFKQCARLGMQEPQSLEHDQNTICACAHVFRQSLSLLRPRKGRGQAAQTFHFPKARLRFLRNLLPWTTPLLTDLALNVGCEHCRRPHEALHKRNTAMIFVTCHMSNIVARIQSYEFHHLAI